MSVTTDEVQWRLTINGSAAKKELAALDQEAYELRQSLKGMKKGTEEFIAANKKLTEVENRMATLRKEIGLNGLTLKQLNAELKRLNMIKGHLTPGTQAFKENAAAIDKVRSRMTQVKSGLGPFQQAWKNLSGEVKGIAIAFGAFMSMQIIQWFQGIIKGAGDLEDQLADVRKTTGMTTEEVQLLNKELGKIDTRTSRKELRDMAIVAGQMGFAGEEVLGFVNAVDKATVALGDEFTGGAEEVATVLGKLRNTLQDLKSSNVQMDLLHIGNAINELGAAGMATGPVVADFANRIGGYGIQAGLTSAQVLGLSATLQELGVTTERGGTAVVKIIQKMFSNVDEFAKIAGMSVADFQELLNKDLYGAFALVMKQSKALGTNSVELNKIIQDLEVSGAGASEVFAKLGGNTSLLEEKVALAGEAVKGTSSIMDEFNIKNATLGATLNKLGKDFKGIFTSDVLVSALKSMVFQLVRFVAVIKEVPNFIRDNWSAIKLLGAAILVFNGRLIASRLAGLADVAVKKLQEIWILRAEYAQAALNKTMNKNPILAITALILGAVAAYKIFTNQAGAARKAQEDLNQRIKEGQDLLANTGKIEDRYKVIDKLSKESLTQLKNDISNEIQAYKDRDGEMVAWAWKNRVNTKLNELYKKFNAEKDALGKASIHAEIEREREVIDQKTKLQFGYSFTEAANNKKRLEQQLESTAARMGALGVEKEAIVEISKQEEKAMNKAAEALENLREKIREIGHQQGLDRLSQNEREIQQIKDKYAKLLEEAVGHKNELIRIQDLMKEEILMKIQEQDAKEEELNKAAAKKKQDFIDEISLITMSGEDAEIEASRRKWMNLITQAEEYGLDVTGLYSAMYMEMENIQNLSYLRELKKNEEKNSELIQQDQAVFEAKTNMLNDFSGLIDEMLGFMGAKQGEYTSFQKALAFTQILIDTATSMSNVIAGATEAASAGGPAAPFLIAGYIASGLGAILGAFANAKAVLADAEVPAYAKGTEKAAPGWKLVGEEGPELINTPGGEKILTHEDSANLLYRMMASGSKVKQPKNNFDFAPSIQRANAFKTGTISSDSYMQKATNAAAPSFSYDDSEMKSLMREQNKRLASLEKTLEAKETGFSFAGRSGFDKRKEEYEEIKELAGRK